MPMPMWVTQINKRFFNKLELKKGERPVMLHLGRSSGREYRTPIDVDRVGDGFIAAVMYSSRSDWVRNVLAAGGAELTVGEERFDLVNPRIISREEALAQLPETFKAPPKFLNVDEYFQADIAR